MQRGSLLEPEARAAYEAHVGVSMPPVCIQSLAVDWLRASLDGLSDDGTRVVEIKCGEGTYRTTEKTGKPPTGYVGQLQHILAITELPEIDFWVYLPNRQPLLVPVNRDEDYIAQMLEREARFWAQVVAT